jgi:hypothetical protein
LLSGALLVASLPLSSCDDKRLSKDTGAATQVLASQKLLSSAVIDLGSEDSLAQVTDGFSPPELVGSRKASWSEGDTSKLTFALRVGASRYVLSFLAEPYFGAQPVALKVTLNGKALPETNLEAGWKGYAMLLEPGVVVDGDNDLSFSYSKTARPADIEPDSADLRELSVRFDQIQVQPITDKTRLSFDQRNAATRAAMGDGWAIDPAERSPGTWAMAPKATLTVRLAKSAARTYNIEWTAHALNGVPEQRVQVELNGIPVGELVFAPKRSTARIQVPSTALRDQNEIALVCNEAKRPQDIDPKSKDARPLCVRALKLEIFPAE